MIDSSQIFNLGTNSDKEHQLKAAINLIASKHVLSDSEVRELIEIILKKAGKDEVDKAMIDMQNELSSPLRDVFVPLNREPDIDGMIHSVLLGSLQICQNLTELTENHYFMPFEDLKEVLEQC